MEARLRNDAHELIKKNLDLADMVSKVYYKKLPNYIPFSDVRDAAYLGLVEAANKYKNIGIGFGAFARPRIFGAITDYLRKDDNLFRSARKMKNEVFKAKRKLEKEN